MSASSNQGILMKASGNGTGTGVTQTLAVAGITVSTKAINVQTGQRVVLTLHFGFSAVTQYSLRTLMKNVNKFLPSGDPANSGGAVEPTFVNAPLLGTSQNDTTAPGVSSLIHTYTSGGGITDDYIEIAGCLVGTLQLEVTTTGGGPYAAADLVVCGLDIF